ncbi:EAL domain-containing protein [Acetobacter sp. TBRC 12305]|uniref:EAL domain-containing protein n=1 Tax=Acetobacter garciniae TaxID=2817435 RepID=A0A939HP81_9PROT|nr:EAL domain-containing protein [Acetobacter garciniae]MBO1326031.1 EAL domain-containing protein [Acetobacter garciniae]MBX0345225.1 EAL domain-containing protein [Acetobacter garciniae]
MTPHDASGHHPGGPVPPSTDALNGATLEPAQFLRMLDQIPVAVMMLDAATLRISYINETSKKTLEQIRDLLPVPVESLIGANVDIFHKNPAHQRALLADPRNLPHRARIRLGDEILDLMISSITGTEGDYIGPMLTWSLVTAQVEAEERIVQLACFDTLTGLKNRSAFFDDLSTTLDQTRLAESPQVHALLFVDLDGFKFVNDTYGHATGDLMLKTVADVLRDICDVHGASLGRIGGDEFAVLVPSTSVETIDALTTKVIATLERPFTLPQGLQHQIGASIGVAYSPEHGVDPTLLLSRADMALYAAKNAGKGTARVFTPEMETRMQMRASLEGMLREAFAQRRDLFVFYQPIIDLKTGNVVSREALLRWYNPVQGWISPADFIPVAEETGLIYELDEFVLATACAEAATWEDEVTVAVNVSAASLGLNRLPTAIGRALAEGGLPAARLNVEVTETALMQGGAEALRDLEAIRAMGVAICLDDFGTGFSSLAHLRSFPFDKIKIDGSFVRDGDKRADCDAIVSALAQLGLTLGVDTVAEGVETAQQYQRIKAEGCTQAQGFLFGRPLPGDTDVTRVGELVAAHKSGAGQASP